MFFGPLFEVTPLSLFSNDCNSRFIAAVNNANNLHVLSNGHFINNVWYTDYFKHVITRVGHSTIG